MNKRTMMLILTSISGNTLEWYDFALYGYFASIIAKLFFPLQNEFSSLIVTFGIFASGFIVRPLGGAVFGHIGDKYGRRAALIISIVLITIPTTLMGLVPSYKTIGIAAPVIFTLLRLLQGVAVSGELTGSGAFLVESAPDKRRGFYGSLIMCSTYLGLLIGSGIGGLVTIVFTQTQIEMFAWRIPFIASFIFGMAAFMLRLKCEESPMFIRVEKQKSLLAFPIKSTLGNYLPQSILIFLLSSSLAVAIYLLIGYLPTFFVSKSGMSLSQSMLISFLGLIVLSILVPIMGLLSDRLSRKFILAIGAVGFVLFSRWIFEAAAIGTIEAAIFSEILIAICLAPIAGTLIALLSETFPTNVRYTGISIGYNASMTVFGGTTPLIAIYLAKTFNSVLAPAYYVVFSGILSLIALVLIKPKYSNQLI